MYRKKGRERRSTFSFSIFIYFYIYFCFNTPRLAICKHPSAVKAASLLVLGSCVKKVTRLTGAGNCSSKEHKGGGTTH